VGDLSNVSARVLSYLVVLYKFSDASVCIPAAPGFDTLPNVIQVSRNVSLSTNITFENLQPWWCLTVVVSATNAASNESGVDGLPAIKTAVPQLLPFKDARVNLSTNVIGAVSAVNVTFVTCSPLGPGDRLVVLFPPVFSLQTVALADISVNGQGSAAAYQAQAASPASCGLQCSPEPGLLLARIDGLSVGNGTRFQVT
jgi:hypothetical protein